jgi:hypothetical protein
MQTFIKHLHDSWLKYLISLFALLLIYAHIFEPRIKIDNIILVLFGFAIFPWLGQLISSFEFQGIGAKFRGVNQGVDERDVDINTKKANTEKEIWEEYNQEKKKYE